MWSNIDFSIFRLGNSENAKKIRTDSELDRSNFFRNIRKKVPFGISEPMRRPQSAPKLLEEPNRPPEMRKPEKIAKTTFSFFGPKIGLSYKNSISGPIHHPPMIFSSFQSHLSPIFNIYVQILFTL